LSKFNISPNTL